MSHFDFRCRIRFSRGNWIGWKTKTPFTLLSKLKLWWKQQQLCFSNTSQSFVNSFICLCNISLKCACCCSVYVTYHHTTNLSLTRCCNFRVMMSVRSNSCNTKSQQQTIYLQGVEIPKEFLVQMLTLQVRAYSKQQEVSLMHFSDLSPPTKHYY